MLFQLKATPAEYKAGLDRAITNGWLVLHESGTFAKFTQAGADLFARQRRRTWIPGQLAALRSPYKGLRTGSKFFPSLGWGAF